MSTQEYALKNDYCIIDFETYNRVLTCLAPVIKENSRVDVIKTTNDLLNPDKALSQAKLLSLFVNMHGKRFLEIGSGLGVNLIVWMKKFGMDGYGMEPQVDEFASSANISKNLLTKNEIDKSRIICAYGEQIPFPSNTFDIIYSTNVLEHVKYPAHVIEEALRVLKPQGILQFVYPNYHSFYDGHYGVFHPPVYWNGFFQWYVKWIFGRNPAFAKSLRTEVNAGWTKKTIADINERIPVSLLSMGEDTFYERMVSINFDAWASLEKVKSLITFSKKCRLNNCAASLMIACKAWTPIILTLKKN